MKRGAEGLKNQPLSQIVLLFVSGQREVNGWIETENIQIRLVFYVRIF